ATPSVLKKALNDYGHAINPATISNLLQFGGLSSGIGLRMTLAKAFMRKTNYYQCRRITPDGNLSYSQFSSLDQKIRNVSADTLFELYREVKFNEYIKGFGEPTAPKSQSKPDALDGYRQGSAFSYQSLVTSKLAPPVTTSVKPIVPVEPGSGMRLF